MTNNTDDDDAIEVYSDYKAKKMIRFLNGQQEKAEKPAMRSEKLVQAMKSNWLELHNTYKGYEAVPPPESKTQYSKKSYEQSDYVTPKTQEHVYEVYDVRADSGSHGDSSKGSSSSSSSTSPQYNQSNSVTSNNKSINMKRAPSLDSLINSSASDTSLDDQSGSHSDSDSGADFGHLFKNDLNDVSRRFSEMSEMINRRHSEICKAEFNDAYIESAKKSEGKKNSFKSGNDATKIVKHAKKISIIDERDAKVDDVKDVCCNGKDKKVIPLIQVNGGRKSCSDLSGSVTSSSASVNSRKFSCFSTGSGGPMETIIEEVAEPKVSVKEILKRFEHLSEKTDVVTAPAPVKQHFI